MSFHIDVSVSFLRRTVSYTETTNTHKNQIVLIMLSASKLVDKKLCHSVTFVFRIVYLSKKSSEKTFLAFKTDSAKNPDIVLDIDRGKSFVFNFDYLV